MCTLRLKSWRLKDGDNLLQEYWLSIKQSVEASTMMLDLGIAAV